MVVECDGCGAKFRVQERHLGKRGKCPGCQTTITIGKGVAFPAPAGSESTAGSPPPSDALNEERLRQALTEPIRPVRPKLTYRLGLLVATLAVLLTPIVYLALIGAVGYGVYYHAVNHTEILTSVRGRGVILAAIVYAAPLVVGPILIFFMFKPFFSRPRFEQKSRSLVRENEPLLFAFVDMVCEAVRAPKPKRIDLDCQMNASASFRRGFLSFLGSDLVLTIGMPLVAGLSARQFGGVLAHEFGHFSQGVGMRLTYVLRSVSSWLARSVYERDAWDQWLATTAGGVDLRVGWVLYLAMLLVWLTRKVLWVLLNLSMAVAGYVLREMEYDADRYEARFGGSDCFEATTLKMARLAAGIEQTYSQLSAAQGDGKLVEDVPGLVVLNESRLSESVSRQIDEHLRTAATGWFDTHPTDKDRIANARAEAAEGVFRLEAPASALFTDFVAQCKATTWEFYRDVLGRAVDREGLRPVEELHAEQEEQEHAYEALARYTQETWRANRPLGLTRGCLEATGSPKEAAAALRESRQRFESGLAHHRELLAEWDKHHGLVAEATAYEALHRGGVRFKKKDVPEAFATREACVAARKKAKTKAAKVGHQLEAVEKAVAERLASALRLVSNDSVAARLPQGVKLGRRASALIPALIAIDGQRDTADALRLESVKLSMLVNAIQHGGATEELIDRVNQGARDVHPRLTQLRDVLGVQAYPFDHANNELTLGSHVVQAVPAREDLGAMVTAVEDSLGKLIAVQSRVAAELCAIAETVESALKLPPLPNPTDGAEASPG